MTWMIFLTFLNIILMLAWVQNVLPVFPLPVIWGFICCYQRYYKDRCSNDAQWVGFRGFVCVIWSSCNENIKKRLVTFKKNVHMRSNWGLGKKKQLSHGASERENKSQLPYVLCFALNQQLVNIPRFSTASKQIRTKCGTEVPSRSQRVDRWQPKTRSDTDVIT